MRGLITANLKVLRTYPDDNDKLIIAKRGPLTSGITSFSSLDGIRSNIHVRFSWFNKFIQFFLSYSREWVELFLGGSIVHNLMWYCSGWLHGYSLISNSIYFGSKIVNKVITAVLLRNVNTSWYLIFLLIVPLYWINTWGYVCFLLKETKSNQIKQF